MPRVGEQGNACMAGFPHDKTPSSSGTDGIKDDGIDIRAGAWERRDYPLSQLEGDYSAECKIVVECIAKP